jgi:hypothetical protein
MNNLVWVFFSMAGISTPTPCQSALLDPSQTPAAIGKQERLDKPGVCARHARAGSCVTQLILSVDRLLYIDISCTWMRTTLTAITEVMA